MGNDILQVHADDYKHYKCEVVVFFIMFIVYQLDYMKYGKNISVVNLKKIVITMNIFGALS